MISLCQSTSIEILSYLFGNITIITAQCRAKTLGFEKTGLDNDSTAFSCYGLGMFQQGETPLVSWFHGKSCENPMKILWILWKILWTSLSIYGWFQGSFMDWKPPYDTLVFLCTNFTEFNSSSLNNYNMDSDAEHNSHNPVAGIFKRFESEDNLRHLSSQTIKPRLVSWSCGRAYHSAGNLESEWIRVNANSVAEYEGQVQVTCSKVILLSLIEWKICDFPLSFCQQLLRLCP